MHPNQFTDNIEKIKAISERLAWIQRVRQCDSEDEPQAWTLASAFLELDKSFRAFVDVQLPRLLADTAEVTDVENTLHDIGEEFRHILYHIKDLKYYEYIHDS